MPETSLGGRRIGNSTNRAVIGFISHDLVFLSVPLYGWSLIMRVIKRLKGIWWMPWRQEAMKDVVRCDKLWGGANNL